MKREQETRHVRGGRREKRKNVNEERTRDTTCERRATREEGERE